MYVRIVTYFISPQLFSNSVYAITTCKIKERYIKQSITVGPKLELKKSGKQFIHWGLAQTGRVIEKVGLELGWSHF